MRGNRAIKEALEDNLHDAGCNKKMIDEFFDELKENNLQSVFELLSKYRISLIKKMHKAQKQIDILDYLILDLKKNDYRKKI